MLKDTSTLTIGERTIFEYIGELLKRGIKVGIIKNTFKNEKEIEEIFNGKITNIEEFFKNLKGEVTEYYKS